MWDPKNRPTSKQAMEHEFFSDAVDPSRPKSGPKLLGRKHSDLSFRSKDSPDPPALTSKPSWFRRSLIARESAPAVPQHDPNAKPVVSEPEPVTKTLRPQPSKRATWTHGTQPVGAPMPILPSIKPVSPLPNAVNAEAKSAFISQSETKVEHTPLKTEEVSKKIGRQLSVNSHGNHYADVHRQEAERALNANSGLVSPPSGHKESFFSHLRKRARRFSGRHGLASPNGDDVEANAATVPWSNRSSIIVDSIIPEARTDFLDLDAALQSVRYSLEKSEAVARAQPQSSNTQSSSSPLKRTHSLPRTRSQRSTENGFSSNTPVSSRTRRALQITSLHTSQYDTPAEEDELLDEALVSASRAARRLNAMSTTHSASRAALNPHDLNRPILPHISSTPSLQGAYLTPSPSAKCDGVQFGHSAITPSQPLNISNKRPENNQVSHWPTPPYEENDWAKSAAASIFATGPGPR